MVADNDRGLISRSKKVPDFWRELSPLILVVLYHRPLQCVTIHNITKWTSVKIEQVFTTTVFNNYVVAARPSQPNWQSRGTEQLRDSDARRRSSRRGRGGSCAWEKLYKL